MFRKLSEPLQLSEASLLALRPALNAPVLNEAFLPVGPARAALIVFAEEWGGIGLALGIRSSGGGQVIAFRNQESIEADVSVAEALEPGLDFGERMGFLFDEDMVAGAPSGEGQSKGLALWGRLMGDIEMPPPPKAVPAEPAATEPILDLPDRPAPSVRPAETGETLLELDLAAVVETPGDVDGSKANAPSASAAGRNENPLSSAALPPSVAPEKVDAAKPLSSTGPSAPEAPSQSVPAASKLSKFRNGDAEKASADPDETQSDQGSALGRIPLVRVRRGATGTKRVSYLARLLSSF